MIDFFRTIVILLGDVLGDPVNFEKQRTPDCELHRGGFHCIEITVQDSSEELTPFIEWFAVDEGGVEFAGDALILG